MDIFRFTNPENPTKMEQGVLINGIKKKMWIERYSEAGEFTFTAPVSSGLREALPRGSFVSHINTDEIMIVENHEIKEQKDAESQITVTGRGYETYLENRIVGTNKAFPVVNSPDRQYVLTSDYTWNQAVQLMRYHTLAAYLLDNDYGIPYLSIQSVVAGAGVQEERLIEIGTVYERLLELLAIEDLGIKVIRPGVNSPLCTTWSSSECPHVQNIISPLLGLITNPVNPATKT